MQKKTITYFVHDYEPDREAASKEVRILFEHFSGNEFQYQITIHDITSRRTTFRFSSSYLAYPIKALPFGYFYSRIVQRRTEFAHVFGSLTGRIYLNILDNKPMVLTNLASLRQDRLESYVKTWVKFDRIVVECYRDKEKLEVLGVPQHKLALIYPGVNLGRYYFQKPDGRFKILFASAPISKPKEDLRNRGVMLVLEAAEQLPQVDFILLWRRKHYHDIRAEVDRLCLKNVRIINEILPNMNEMYGRIHCLILPTVRPGWSKPCPNSAIESLAAGKPVLLSNLVGIADLILEEQCGIVFEPDKDNLVNSIEMMQKDYRFYQQNCRQTADRHFCQQLFLRKYEDLYSDVLG